MFKLKFISGSTNKTMTKKRFIRKYRLTENQFNGIEPIRGNLDLSELTQLPDGWVNIWVTGNLYLSNIKTINTEVNFRVGGWLYLNSLTKITTNICFIVGSCLDLSSVTNITNKCSFNVGGYLNLFSLTKITSNCTFNVGNWLWLLELTKITGNCGFNIGDRIVNYNKLTFNQNKLSDGDVYTDPLSNKQFLFADADNTLIELTSKKGNLYAGKYLGSGKPVYVVTDGTYYAHGSTFEEAKEELIHKIEGRDKYEYDKTRIYSKIQVN